MQEIVICTRDYIDSLTYSFCPSWVLLVGLYFSPDLLERKTPAVSSTVGWMTPVLRDGFRVFALALGRKFANALQNLFTASIFSGVLQ